MRFPHRLLPVTAKAFGFLLRPDLVIAQPVVGRAKALVKRDCPAAFLRPARETGFHRVVAAVSFAVRFSPGVGPSAVVLFGLCRCPICLVTAGFGPAADPFDPAGSGSGFAVVAVAAAAAVVAGPVVAAVVVAADLS